MAMDMFMKIGKIDGESKDSVHKKSIDVLAWSWGASNSGSAHTGGGAGSGKANFQDVSFTKYIDSSSPAILTAVSKGEHFPDALLTVRKAGGDAPVEYIKLEMKEVLISSVSTGGSGGEDKLTENVTLNFGKFTYTYMPQEDAGKGKAGIISGWDIAQNVKL